MAHVTPAYNTWCQDNTCINPSEASIGHANFEQIQKDLEKNDREIVYTNQDNNFKLGHSQNFITKTFMYSCVKSEHMYVPNVNRGHLDQ